MCADEELLCAEFDAIIAAGWGCARPRRLRDLPVRPRQCGMRPLPRAPRGAPHHAGAPRSVRRPPALASANRPRQLQRGEDGYAARDRRTGECTAAAGCTTQPKGCWHSERSRTSASDVASSGSRTTDPLVVCESSHACPPTWLEES